MVKLPLLILGIVCIVLGASVSGGTALAFGLGADEARPGLGLAALALFDVIVIYTFLSIAFQAIGLGWFVGRLQGITGLVVGLVGVIGGIVLAMAAVAALATMVTLLVSVPFGTIVYLAVFGHFDTDTGRAILALVEALKIGGFVLVVLSSPTVLKNKSIVALGGVSVLFGLLLGFLYGFPPNILVSIADAIGAIVIAVVTVVWMALLLFSGVSAVFRAVRGAVPG